MAQLALSLIASIALAQPPGNDDCETAYLIEPGLAYGATYDATAGGGATCGNSDSTPDVWYRYEATETVKLTLSTCNEGTTFDTVLSVHDSCPTQGGNELTCSDDACGTRSQIETSVAAGESLWIRVSGSDGAIGDYDLTLILGPPPVSLPDAANEDGWTIQGANISDDTGARVAAGGDFNGDGIDDVALSVPDYPLGGIVYVVFGVPGDTPPFDTRQIDGSNGVVLSGAPFSEAGASVAWAGDVNGDGFDDVIIGDPELDPFIEDAGGAFVVYGSPMPPPEIPLLTLDAAQGFALYGYRIRDQVGGAAAGAGDVNGDGFDDLLIAAPAAPEFDASGEVYLVYGAPAIPGVIDLGELDGSNGIQIQGASDSDSTGTDVAGAGDVNRDGYDDFLIGAPTASILSSDDGVAYLIYGGPELPNPFDLSELEETSGVAFEGTAHRDGEAGTSLDGSGDVNGDGFVDLVIGAPEANPGGRRWAGEVYIVYGGAALPGRVDLGALDATSGAVLEGPTAYERAGGQVGGGGDWNGDGLDDVVVGIPRSGLPLMSRAGQVFVIYGSQELPAREQLPNLIPEGGARYIGGDSFDGAGADVSVAGDINGDGIDDLLVGAPDAYVEGLGSAGEAYVLFGSTRGEYLVGDWDGDGRDNFAVRLDGTIYMDYGFDGTVDQVQEFGDGDLEDEYLVGDWDGDGRDNLAVRHGHTISMDTNFDTEPELVVAYGGGANEDEYLIADFDGDGRDDLAVRRGNRVLIELWPWEDGMHDVETKYGGGESEDQYLAGNWTNDARGNQTLAVRRGAELWINANFDGAHDHVLTYGRGHSEDQYLVGDWDGDGVDNVAVRRGYDLLMALDRDPWPDRKQRFGPGAEP